MADSALEVTKLTVKYAERVAVNELSFSIKSGEIYGLLGPNGAGKSSTIKSVLGLVKYAGGIDILGMGPPSSRVMNSIGVVMETPALLEALTPREFFEFAGSVRGSFDQKRVEALVEAFELGEYMDMPIASLSAGNKQKVAVVSAMMHRPKLLLLDEPFNALDVKSVRIMKGLIQKHVDDGGAVLFSTHIMEVAEKICTRIGIINAGKIMAEGTLQEIEEQANAGNLEDAFLKTIHADEQIKSLLEGL
ncbi:MAG: ABC transporter ATP-binding protein [Nitrososphaerota archaeon]|jgi:ABC-2 type transport system ATP-binding protein|nr:ABC transporter ATP-binding protein [Nitrososphaerota archaeon]MDG6931850.1 ABC transporter ATP-binding protein [Nitrososphaerota archaeon]MDG6936630.1 ABC transporter ATP-binding protein [Nitrososphaerota archaeon]MDG6944424.1 ABC transporter ATP-binding protein [Nitrososphaerota archaeon]